LKAFTFTFVASNEQPMEPPKSIPYELLAAYSWSISLEYFYVDDSNSGQGTHYVFNQDEINNYVEATRKYMVQNDENDLVIDCNIHNLNLCRKQLIRIGLQVALLRTYGSNFSNFDLAVVFGSSEPWVEAIAIAFGCKNITTIDYNKLTYGENIITISKESFYQFYSNTLDKFDVAFSMSSFDHDGLGRYGDPLNPIGDILAMRNVHRVLKDDGRMFLSLPIGPDLVVFNTLRRYGVIRLPLILTGTLTYFHFQHKLACLHLFLNITHTIKKYSVAWNRLARIGSTAPPGAIRRLYPVSRTCR